MDVADRIDRLFGDDDFTPDPSGVLERMANQVAEHDPRLVLTASRNGEPRFAYAVDGRRYGARDLRAMAHAALGLRPEGDAAPGAPGILYPCYRGEGSSDVLLLWCARDPTTLSARQHESLARNASIVLLAISLRADRDRLETRVRQLENEHGVLSATHNETVAALLESREEAARLERDQLLALEAEVERRSADLRAALEQAELANRAKATFLATMSHEIRTPLTAILGYADLLRSTSLEPGEVAEYTDVIRCNGRQLLSILNDILDYSQMESRSVVISESRFSVLDLVGEVATACRPAAEAKGLRIHVAADTDDFGMSSDRGRTLQILSCLVQNAVKFTERGEIGIRVSSRTIRGEEHVVIEVSDTGIGMETDDVERIFEAFTQTDQSSTRRFSGAGLGLPISRSLARLLGGEITVDSRSGRGSTFRVTLLRTLSGAAAKRGDGAGAVPESDELVSILRDFLEGVPDRVERLRGARTDGEWIEVVAEAQRLGEEADVLQVEPLQQATSGLLLAADSRDPGRLDRAARDLLDLVPQLLRED